MFNGNKLNSCMEDKRMSNFDMIYILIRDKNIGTTEKTIQAYKDNICIPTDRIQENIASILEVEVSDLHD